MTLFRIVGLAAIAASAFAAPSLAACSGTVSGTTSLATLDASSIGDSRAGPKQCTWIVKRIDTGDCTIGRVRVESAGPNRGGTVLGSQIGSPRPSQIEVERVSDGAVAAMRSTTADGDGWHWTGTNLNCSVLGCGTSRYRVRTLDPVSTCSQTITVILTTL